MERRIVELLRAGHGTNQISRELGVCKKRVKRIRELAEGRGYLDPEITLPAPPEALFPEIQDRRSERRSDVDERLDVHKDWIRERLDADWHPITVFEELPDKSIPRSSFYRFLHRHELITSAARRVVPAIDEKPGDALYVDWGKLCTINIHGKRVPVWAFIGGRFAEHNRGDSIHTNQYRPWRLINLRELLESKGIRGLP